MKYLHIIVLIILVLLSLAAGGAKIMEMPQEVQFFETAGLNTSLLLPLGVVQVVGALLAIYPPARKAGAAIMALGFLCSAMAIFMTGNTSFGTFSLLPVLLSLFLVWRAGGQSANS